MRNSVTVRWLVVPVLLGAAALAMPPVLAEESAAAGDCASGTVPDFNGDRIADVVLGRPLEQVDGQGSAGAVAVLYGGAKGTGLISQNTPGLAGTAESGDQFGTAVALADVDRDNCFDLVVSAPYEDVATKTDAGAVWVIPGSPTGLNPSGGYVISQDSPGIPGSAEHGDRFGRSIAASLHRVLIGAPGEDHHAVDSGSVYVVVDGVATVVHQDSPRVPGSQEAGDRFGEVVSDAGSGFLVGVPYESVGSRKSAGMVHSFRWLDDGSLRPGRAFTQNDSDVTGSSEAGDHFGASISASRFVAGAEAHLAFAIGVPGESLTSEEANHGMVQVFYMDTFDHVASEKYTVHQNTYGVAGAAELSDRFGALVHLWASPPDPEDDGDRHLMVTVMSGNEDFDVEQGTGPAIQVFEGFRDVGYTDRWIRAGSYGLPADADLSVTYACQYAGKLFLADVDEAHVYGVPTGNVAFGESEPVVVYGP